MAKGVLEGLASGFFGGFERTFTPALKRGWADAKAAERRGEEIAWRENQAKAGHKRWEKEFGLRESGAKATADWRTQQAETAAEQARLLAGHRTALLAESGKDRLQRAKTARLGQASAERIAGIRSGATVFNTDARGSYQAFRALLDTARQATEFSTTTKGALIRALTEARKHGGVVSEATLRPIYKSALSDGLGQAEIQTLLKGFGFRRDTPKPWQPGDLSR